ncbi:RNA polymerase subunit sigma-24 [Actinophytocola xinjiangensis]|uniref:RNA polymerase subunit sigma-24 n=1 Tax=Actinophytocola xinjiangensis TaxID=485602 RepID=A0A7Z0WEN5_9PSEU|nr:SigE family RNA polymerase sigma factor [Actinophytocola xinjiangensis]OLF05105.1 RNA polymerase subunit sigma-24 [Actinophytocola xinjiangensis]
MKRSEEESYRDYVVARTDVMRRTAYLLCRDWHTADDLVAITMVKLYRHWSRIGTESSLDAYTRRTLLRTWLDEKRRPWRRHEELAETLPDTPDPVEFAVVSRAQLLDLLSSLPPRRRAAVVLRGYLGLSLEETAEILGCSVGTVKSQTARGLDTLRAMAAGTD